MEKKKKNRVLNLQEQDKILEKSQKTNDAMPKVEREIERELLFEFIFITAGANLSDAISFSCAAS